MEKAASEKDQCSSMVNFTIEEEKASSLVTDSTTRIGDLVSSSGRSFCVNSLEQGHEYLGDESHSGPCCHWDSGPRFFKYESLRVQMSDMLSAEAT